MAPPSTTCSGIALQCVQVNAAATVSVCLDRLVFAFTFRCSKWNWTIFAAVLAGLSLAAVIVFGRPRRAIGQEGCGAIGYE